VQREMVDGGLLGRKSGRGFYSYPDGAPALPVAVLDAPHTAREVAVHGDDALADDLEHAAAGALASQGWGPERVRGSGWTGLAVDGARLVLCSGSTAHALSHTLGVDDIAVFDRPLVRGPGTALAYALSPRANADWQAQAPAWLAALGYAPLPVADTPGLVVARTVAMLINEAADAVQQGVCTANSADAAMKLGVNYPAGPFEWLAGWHVDGIDLAHAHRVAVHRHRVQLDRLGHADAAADQAVGGAAAGDLQEAAAGTLALHGGPGPGAFDLDGGLCQCRQRAGQQAGDGRGDGDASIDVHGLLLRCNEFWVIGSARRRVSAHAPLRRRASLPARPPAPSARACWCRWRARRTSPTGPARTTAAP